MQAGNPSPITRKFSKVLRKIVERLVWWGSGILTPLAIYKLFGILPVRGISYKTFHPVSHIEEPDVQHNPLPMRTRGKWVVPPVVPLVMNHVVEIHQGIASHLGYVFDEAGYAVIGASHRQAPRPSGKPTSLQRQKILWLDQSSRLLPRIQKIEGTVAVVTASTQHTYFHWLFDVLPRLGMLEQAGKKSDHIFLQRRHRFQRETLDLLGVDGNAIIDCDRVPVLQASTLSVPCHEITYDREYPQWVCGFLRASFLSHAAEGKSVGYRRIYISRKTASHRRLLNEPEILALLKTYGFQEVDLEEWSFLDQVRLFRDAEIIVGPHGSGLANLVFCRAGTRVIELFPRVGIDYYWRLCEAVGLTYDFVNAREGDPLRCGLEDYVISLEDLHPMLELGKASVSH